MSKLFALAWLSLLGATIVFGQVTIRSSIGGVVTDSSLAVVPDAEISVEDVDRNQTYTTMTNSEGVYSLSNLTPSRYKVTVQKAGFRKTVSDDIVLASNQSARYDLTLQVGEVTETVEVVSTTPLIQTAEAVVGGLADQRLVENLPVSGRNFLSFSILATNVSGFPRANRGDTWSIGAHHMVGGAEAVPGGGGNTGYFLNGVSTTDNYMGLPSYAPTVESISEVKMDTANFSAVNGRDVATFNIVTRGGTNEYHGAVYDYLQNSELNAWDPLTKAQAEPGQRKSLFQRNQFGGKIGGPISVPKVFSGRDRLFGFIAWERLVENRAGSDALFRVPTQTERQGDFSGLLTRFPNDPNFILYDPFSTIIDENGDSIRTPIPNNDLRRIGLHPDASELVNIYPLPSGFVNPANPNDLRNHRTFQRTGIKSWRYDSRVDVRPSNSDNVYFSLSQSSGITDNEGGLIPELTADQPDTSWVVTVNWARVFSPNLTNEFIYSQARGNLATTDAGTIDYLRRTDTLRSKFFENLGGDESQGFFAIGINGNGYSSICCREVFDAINESRQFSDTVSWVRGAHTLKGGFTYLRKREFDPNFVRAVDFDTTFTRAGSVHESRGGDPIASLLLGLPTTIDQRFNFQGGDPNLDAIIPYWGFFIEDKWQVTPKLTLSLGLRYDLVLPLYHRTRYGMAFLDFDVPGWELQIPGRAPGLEHRPFPTDKNNFAPRIGLAYKLKENFVLRGAYGIFYDGGQTTTSGNAFLPIFSTVPNITGDVFNNSRFGVHDDLPVLKFEDIFPPQQGLELGIYPVSTGTGTGWFDFPKGLNYADNDSFTVPYFQRYLLEMQKGVGYDTVLTFSFLGGRGTKLPYYENINPTPYRTGWPSLEVYNAARPSNNPINYNRWTNTRVLRHGLNSFYNAGTIKLERRMSTGLQLLTHYTWSKTVIDNIGTFYNPAQHVPGGGDCLEFLDGSSICYDWNRHLSRGEAPFSHPHRWVTALTYELPWGRTLPGVAKTLIHGWNASGIITFESGNALTAVNGVTSARDFEPDLPNRVGDPNSASKSFTQQFNSRAFSNPGQDVKGNAGWGIIRGPGRNNWEVSLKKSFAVTERVRVDFQADMFNAFNHIQWSDVDTVFSDASDSTFGWATAAHEPRIIQFGLRVSF